MSGYLLDTHLLLWAGLGSKRLSAAARGYLDNPDTNIFFSVVSLWEIVIKSQLNRADFRVNPETLRTYAHFAAMRELPILANHVMEVRELPALHGDPFDRLLVAQARVENLTLLTVDDAVLAYGAGTEKA